MYESARYKRAECMVEQGDRAGAIEALKALLNDRPEYTPAIVYLGELVAYQRGHAMYIEPFDRQIEASPDDAEAWFQRANGWVRMGESERAKADYIRAAELAPDDMRIGDRAIEERASGKDDNAGKIALLDAYLERFPQSTRALDRRASQFRWQGDHARAMDDFRRIAAMQPEDSEVYRDIADLYGEMGRPEEGIEAATHALELAGDDKIQAAMALLTRAELREKIDPNDPLAAEDDARADALRQSVPELVAFTNMLEGVREAVIELRERVDS